ncbi:30 kDa heat shock protein [Lachnellula arida]|uniref:30 kDa heat shock protein n=1 Tax=Lachnellula arida TaxID=1316785 RepID=A0A8T9BPF2_9HELO|nr:30 kDa heat shock protein [Lachnellula arida]
MSLFPRSSFQPLVSEPSFTPLFRLLDEFDSYNGAAQRQHHRHRSKPKFDVKEVESGYELHGELPGIDQKNVEIEFVDPQTLSIRGHVERSYESGEAPAASSGAIKEAGETKDHSNSHKATVEDDAKEPATPPSETNKQVQRSSQQQEQAPASRYWVSERSIGSFSRTFSFPVRVDQDHVRASMKDGILSIVVPKTNEKGSRKITIN